MSRDHDIQVSHDFVGAVPLCKVTTLLSLESIGLMELEIIAFVISVPIPFPRFTNGLKIVCFYLMRFIFNVVMLILCVSRIGATENVE